MLAAEAQDGVWALDVGDGAWQHLDVAADTGADVVAVSAAGEDAPVLVLTDDGALHAYDAATGERTASQQLIDGDVADTASIAVDTSRAYVNDAAASTVHEIDYNDDLRVARTFDLDVTPEHMVETGQ
ncbi:hypothetical protein [Saccharomonospora sp. CUA-673]|uniref:hypothetical protein n=1 Tax=Saccharomonospora sp. CUA-673 TaxID=1904969 RepID=UPI000AC50975|nr:hypothetical protein [Saccharomonospora sp. CUA-673]